MLDYKDIVIQRKTRALILAEAMIETLLGLVFLLACVSVCLLLYAVAA